ncbi:hypothetical protein BS50DRAFT_494349 [Corynespora cassiicola Philippines]|uniref:Uncharacterized protein n=1 Tax=Corynespora cassiicola Philippines TaxID=1448308 RepID=A0A2T2NPR5_CORCC|nr:hypothetical protein BS50DRAFT_494349 [Corynespora cassiicola Philippines]
MNRFLTRRKDRVVDDNASVEKPAEKSFWGKSKKVQPEPKPELDLTMALPDTNDFRTSLIMPSLSTRFSMLREQDDPDSKIGKASDDSVLQPKRQSRLHEFGFMPGGLSDIAEVSSLNGSIRPPFTSERQNSFDSTATQETSGGSMMSRARPGEGNVLFGGRQKIYKISNTGSSKGRALYEDDVSMSTFQRLRLEEKERRERELAEQDALQSEPSSPTKDALYSPSTDDYNQRRETTSSTNSGTVDTRISTAATSIASQGANSVPASSPAFPSSATPTSPTELARSTTKTRRLYDQGLDQHIYDQQSSAINRLNSLQRTRAPTGRATPPLAFSQTRSATNLNDRFNRAAPFRTDSPTPQGNPGASTAKDAPSGSSSPIISRPTSPPPMSPLGSDSEEAQTLNSALQPGDRGKATAMGAFNKPKQAFSEQQYAERLKQMQQEQSNTYAKLENARKSSVRERAEPEKAVPTLDNPRKPSLRERIEQEKRKRAQSIAGRQRTESTAEPGQAPSPFSVFQSAASQMKSPTSTAPQNVQSPDSQAGKTFFASPGSSDDEEDASKNVITKPTELGRRLENIPTATGPAPSLLEHPALRSRSNSRLDDKMEHPALRSRSASRPAALDHPALPKTDDVELDSPTLGPNNGGLSGLIRQHLRNVSNVSSNYDDSHSTVMSPPATSTGGALSLQTQNFGLQRRQPASESDTPAHSSYSHSNPWDLDDIDHNPFYTERDSVSSVSPSESQKPKPAPTSAATDAHSTHTRMASADTIDEEHEAFQRDLAQRQRAVQESLRARAEGQPTGPTTGQTSGGLKTALNMLRAKSSHESFATVDMHKDGQPKGMRMLGVRAPSANASSTSLAAQHGVDPWKSEASLRQKSPHALHQSEQDAQRELRDRVQRSGTDDSQRDARPKGRTPPASSRSSTRDRSSSEVSSGRSRSRPRNGHYRDDLEQAMAEGRSTYYPANSMPSVPGYVANPTQPLPTERPSLDSQGRMRSRSNSRTAAAKNFESKHLQPIQTGNGAMNGSSPRLSPAGNSPQPPQFSPGLPASPRPSPGNPSPNMSGFRPQALPVPPFAATATPPVSNPTTPVAPGFTSSAAYAAAHPISKTGTLRKKSIAKADISEPVFVSTTSVIDTINLPVGASLKNGVEAPPVPPINPMRRRFGFGQKENHDPAVHPGLDAPHAPFAEPTRTNSSDALSSQANPPPRQRLRKSSSEGRSLHGKAQGQGASPAVPAVPYGRNNSPPRPINTNPVPQRPMDGAMF